VKIGGVSIVLVLGIINFLLLSFQLSSGLRLLKVKMTVHRKTGITLFFVALCHGILGYLAS
jgi:hypothetical protein